MIPIVPLSIVILILYWIAFFLKLNKPIQIPLIFTLMFLPKINLMGVSSLSTAGIRVDDFIVVILLVTSFQKNFYSNKWLRKAINILVFLSISNLLALFFGVLKGYDNQILYSLLVIIRRIEYFSLIFTGIYIAKDTNFFSKYFLKEFTTLNVAYFIVAFLQIIGICGYAVSGSDAGNFFAGMAVATFNGYYEYGQFLCFSAVVFLLFYLDGHSKKSLVLFLISCVFLYMTNSRTTLISFVLVTVFILVPRLKTKVSKSFFIFISILLQSVCLFLIFTNLRIISTDSIGRFSSFHIKESIVYLYNSIVSGSFNMYRLMIKQGARVTQVINATSDLSTSIRFFKWGAAIDGFTKNPILGYGYGVTHVMDGNYIRIIGETGVLGTYLWMKLYIMFMKICKKNWMNSLWVKATYFFMISVIISATFIDMFDASKIMEFLWLMIGVSIQESIFNYKQIKGDEEK